MNKMFSKIIDWNKPPFIISSIVAIYWIIQFGVFGLTYKILNEGVSRYLSFMATYLAVVLVCGLPIVKADIWFGSIDKTILLIVRLFVSLLLALTYLLFYTMLLIYISPIAAEAAGFGHEFTVFPLAIIVGHIIVLLIKMFNWVKMHFNRRIRKGKYA